MEEEQKHIDNVERVHRKHMTTDANIVSSHVVYKIKVGNEKLLCLKARRAPQGNNDSEAADLRSDFCMCSSTSTRIVFILTSVRKWRPIKISV